MTYEAFKTEFHITLNEQQAQAVQAVDGPVLLLAVPGSGKTTVLVSRLGYMIYGCDIAPEQILTMTYTVAATRDMKQRFVTLFGDEMADRLEFRTINGVSARIIRTYENAMGREAFQLISDEKELSALVGEIYRRITGEFPTESDIKGVRTAITYAKNQMLTRDEIEAMTEDLKSFPAIYQEYTRVLREQGRMDYDDQMVYALQILRQYPDILRSFHRRYRYLCVDEAQDTSKIQHRIIELLAKGSGNIFMVGDEDQSIYGFRAAYPAALLQFEATYPGAKILLMEQNYRSTRDITELADRFIQKNANRRPKHMSAVRGSGKAVREVSLHDRKAQYQYLMKVAQNCTQQTAVLFRDNDCALPLIDLFERNGIPYRCRQMDGSFFTHRITRDITDIIRLALHPDDRESFLRVYYKFSAGITKAAAEHAAAYCASYGGSIMEYLGEMESLSPWARKQCRSLHTHMTNLLSERADKAVYRIIHFMGYGDYLLDHGASLDRAHILEALGEQEGTPLRLLERLEELQDIVREMASNPDCPFILSTVHSSKGLEYDRVFLMDVLDGLLPKAEEGEELEEERRLFYVAMTRTKDELIIFTFQKPGLTSSFSEEVFPPKQKAETTFRPAPKPLRSVTGSYRSPAASQEVQWAAKDYLPGRAVRHKQFGSGMIRSRTDDKIVISFDDGAEKQFSLSVALKAKALTLSDDQ